MSGVKELLWRAVRSWAEVRACGARCSRSQSDFSVHGAKDVSGAVRGAGGTGNFVMNFSRSEPRF